MASFSNSRLVQNRLSFSVNVMGYGADSTGVNDCSVAFQAAINECRTRDYATLLIPASDYRFDLDVATARKATCYIDVVRLSVTQDSPTAAVGLLPLQMQRSTAGDAEAVAAQIDYFKYQYRPAAVDVMYPE